MRTLYKQRVVLAGVVLGLAALVAACGGSGSGSMTSGAGAPLHIQISSTGGNALLSGVPAEALTAAGAQGSAVAAMDRPGNGQRPTLQSFELTFASISARNDAGELVPVTIALPATVDVLGLRSGGSVDLPVGFLPAGSYQGFNVTVTAAVLVLQDGTRITIEPPGEGWTVDVRTQPFTVVDGQATTVELNVRCDLALRWIVNHFEFHPVFDCHVGRGDDDSDSGSGSDDK